MGWVEKSTVIDRLCLSETGQGDSSTGSAFSSQTYSNVYSPFSEFALSVSRAQNHYLAKYYFHYFWYQSDRLRPA